MTPQRTHGPFTDAGSPARLIVEASPPQRAREAARQSLAALRRGDRQAARRLAFHALELDPRNEDAWLLLAALSKPDARERYLEYLLSIHPESSRALLALDELSRSEPAAVGVQLASPVGQVRPRPDAVPVPAPPPEGSSVPESPRQANMASGLLRRAAVVLGTLVAIAYLTQFGLILAEHGRQGLPAQFLVSAREALSALFTYIIAHPWIYVWHRYELWSFGLVAQTFANSAGLLLIALGIAVALGVPLGLVAALGRRRGGAVIAVLVSVIGISTPSFLLAMLFWVADIGVHRAFDIKVLPTTGFGWDAHLIMPALVLAARPLAQVAQITYVSLAEVLSTDYIRTARSKGLAASLVVFRHAFRNIWVPVLTTLGTSLRFSLASLPVVELFFDWPGVGSTLLEAIQLGNAPLVTDLIVSLGLFFVVVNQGLEWIFPLLNPPMRRAAGDQAQRERDSLLGLVRDGLGELTDRLGGVRHRLRGRGRALASSSAGKIAAQTEAPSAFPESHRPRRGRRLRMVLLNPMLLVGGAAVLFLALMATNGEHWTAANAYQPHGVMMIEGKIGAPPYAPSSVFPWGTDELGRDLQALVFAGARQTLMLALFATLARLIIGSFLGMFAGWTQGSWLDQLVSAAMGVWAAFPVTLFAMIVIQAIGIKGGVWVFVVGLSVVGWGEVAQLTRSKVIELKPRLFVEAARSIGSRSTHILRRHLLPNLVGPLLVVSALEMGGVLMLLAELGFLSVFLGGGFQVMIGEAGAMIPIIEHLSDIPEWGALLASIRQWWRSYPWMAWYPGLAFFTAIMAFNLLGEGLRRVLDKGVFDLSRLVNRYTLLVVAAAAAGVVFWFRATSPLGAYQDVAGLFDTQRAMAHIQELSLPKYAGRETGTPGAQMAAEYIASQMQAIGLSPAGDGNSFIQTQPAPRRHLAGIPQLRILAPDGGLLSPLIYRRDFVDLPGNIAGQATVMAPIVGLALGPDLHSGSADPFGLRNYDLSDRVIIVRMSDLPRVNTGAAAGTLVVVDDPLDIQRRYALPARSLIAYRQEVILAITPDIADALLASAGSSLKALDASRAGLKPGEVATTDAGATIQMEVTTTENPDLVDAENYYNIVGFIPGTGSSFSQAGGGLDSQVVMISAYYDGVGDSPDGAHYPGANDNASGVATLLELARAMKASPYAPKRTVVFAVWAGGDRFEGLSVVNMMNSHVGFSDLSVEDVIELSGVGAGTGSSLAFDQTSSYRLVKLFEAAASRLGYPTTTRGRGPHYGLPVIPGFGGRAGLSLAISWDGSDHTAFTPLDTYQSIDPNKLEQAGRISLLGLTVVSREANY